MAFGSDPKVGPWAVSGVDMDHKRSPSLFGMPGWKLPEPTLPPVIECLPGMVVLGTDCTGQAASDMCLLPSKMLLSSVFVFLMMPRKIILRPEDTNALEVNHGLTLAYGSTNLATGAHQRLLFQYCRARTILARPGWAVHFPDFKGPSSKARSIYPKSQIRFLRQTP